MTGSCDMTSRFVRACGFAVCISFALTGAFSMAEEEAPSLPTLHTNQQFIEDVTRRSALDIEDEYAVLEFILSQLPERVRVYPSENYYYFYFYHGGVQYAGNLRLPVEERDKGLAEFIYFKATTELARDERDYHVTIGNSDGVIVDRLEELVYRVSFRGRDVIFELEDLSDVQPPDGLLGASETFLGPVFDESGVRFFLTFDEHLKLFHFVLDETVPVADDLLKLPSWNHILIGRRTSFAFFADPLRDRKVLVGVFATNALVNSYYDGPFDQLPDNFVKGDELRRALLLANPDLEAEPLDRLGAYPGGEFRRKIAPYREYSGVPELETAEKCGNETSPDAVDLCLDRFFNG